MTCFPHRLVLFDGAKPCDYRQSEAAAHDAIQAFQRRGVEPKVVKSRMARSEVNNFIKRVGRGSLVSKLVANRSFLAQAIGDEAAERLDVNTADIIFSTTYLAAKE